MNTFIPWILLFLGVVSRIVVPWLIARRDNPDLPWKWLYIWPQLISFVVIALMLPILIDNLEGISSLSYQAAYLIGWAAADIGNSGRKFMNGGTDV